MRRAMWVVLAVSASGCGGNDAANKYASAAATAGVYVAAAGVYRAATGGCWASCAAGTACDEESGTCVAEPCRGSCPVGSRCKREGGRETCVVGRPDLGDEEVTADAPRGDVAPPRVADPCRGMCFAGERCVTDAGVADCVAP